MAQASGDTLGTLTSPSARRQRHAQASGETALGNPINSRLAITNKAEAASPQKNHIHPLHTNSEADRPQNMLQKKWTIGLGNCRKIRGRSVPIFVGREKSPGFGAGPETLRGPRKLHYLRILCLKSVVPISASSRFTPSLSARPPFPCPPRRPVLGQRVAGDSRL